MVRIKNGSLGKTFMKRHGPREQGEKDIGGRKEEIFLFRGGGLTLEGTVGRLGINRKARPNKKERWALEDPKPEIESNRKSRSKNWKSQGAKGGFGYWCNQRRQSLRRKPDESRTITQDHNVVS